MRAGTCRCAGYSTETGAPLLSAVPPPLALEATGLTKRFGALTALDNVSLKLRPGTVHALLGENGAGKSTLVKCIMGYYQADEGRVLVGGNPAKIESPRDAAGDNIGMLRGAVGMRTPIAQKQGWIRDARLTAAVIYTRDGPRLVVVCAYQPGLTLARARLLGRSVLRALRIP